MRNLGILVIACALATVSLDNALGAPAPKATPLTKAQKARAEQIKRSAPADEYFGRMKLSYLGVNNTFRDQAIRAGDHTTNGDVVGKVRFAEESLRAWRQKYPHDPQLARSLFLASRVDLKIWVADFQQRAAHYMIELRDKFSSTFFGKQTKAELKKGMTMHFYAEPIPCSSVPAVGPVSTPTPLATEDPKDNIKVSVIPVPCYTPAPPPSPAPSATLSPAPSPLPKATLLPSPTPAPTPQATPTPTASASPVAN